MESMHLNPLPEEDCHSTPQCDSVIIRMAEKIHGYQKSIMESSRINTKEQQVSLTPSVETPEETVSVITIGVWEFLSLKIVSKKES